MGKRRPYDEAVDWQQQDAGDPEGATTPAVSDGQRPPLTDNSGHGRTAADDDGQPSTISSRRKTDAHTMSSVDAARIFEKLGNARSQRSIERYCESGDLDCFRDPDVRQWYITRQSVERLASYFREVAQKKGEAVSPTGGNADATRRAALIAGREAAGGAEFDEWRKRTKELEAANRDLEIASRVKDEFIKRLEQDREAFVKERGGLIGRLEQRAHQVGLLEANLQLLDASGRRRTERDAATTDGDARGRRVPVESERAASEQAAPTPLDR